MLRIFFLLLILAGGALGIGYPWLAGNMAGYQIGTWRVFEEGGGFVPAETLPAPSEAPIFVTVEMTTRGPLRADREGAVLTLAARSGGRTVLEQELDFRGADGRLANPQTGELVYRSPAWVIRQVAGDGLVIEVGRGDAAGVRLVAVDVIVEASAIDTDPRAAPAGYLLMAIGLVGFLVTFRSRKPKNPNSSPPPPRWGRQ